VRHAGLSKQRRTAISELQIRSTLVPPQPSQRNGALDPGSEILAAATDRQKRRVNALDVDAAILRRLDAVCDLDQLARGGVGIGEVGGSRRTSWHLSF
jgi:hypothetical protein